MFGVYPYSPMYMDRMYQIHLIAFCFVYVACVNDFSGALFWNSSRRNSLVIQPCSTLHPSFRSGVNIARHCNSDGTWSPVDMTACTMFINSNPVIVVHVHFTVTVSDSSTVDPTIIISNVSS